MNKDGDLKQTLKEVKHLLLAWLFFASGKRMLKSLLVCHHGFFGNRCTVDLFNSFHNLF